MIKETTSTCKECNGVGFYSEKHKEVFCSICGGSGVKTTYINRRQKYPEPEYLSNLEISEEKFNYICNGNLMKENPAKEKMHLDEHELYRLGIEKDVEDITSNTNSDLTIYKDYILSLARRELTLEESIILSMAGMGNRIDVDFLKLLPTHKILFNIVKEQYLRNLLVLKYDGLGYLPEKSKLYQDDITSKREDMEELESFEKLFINYKE